jgi:hypothetical protein
LLAIAEGKLTMTKEQYQVFIARTVQRLAPATPIDEIA